MQRTLLIIDDIRVNRKILIKILGGDYNVIKAADRIKATDIMSRGYNDISADLSMPKIDSNDEYITGNVEYIDGSWETLLTEKMTDEKVIYPPSHGRITLIWDLRALTPEYSK